jgi:thiol-disulfide isomerase/thioredoxin
MRPTLPHLLPPAAAVRALLSRARLGVLPILVVAVSAWSGSARAQPNPAEVQNLNQQLSDPEQAGQAIPRVRSLLAVATDSAYVGLLRQMLLKGLVASGASSKEVADAADSTLPYVALTTRTPAVFYGSLARLLASRREELPRALGYARTGVRSLPDDDSRTPGMRGFAYGSVGVVHFEAGRLDSARTWLMASLPFSPDSQEVLVAIARTEARMDRKDEAIDHFARALGVFPPGDTSGTGELGALYKSRHGSLKGLDAKIAAARKASTSKVALETRRHERTAPPWKLQGLDGSEVALESFKGKVVVLDFWGSWCGPCRYEMPLIEALYKRYQKDGKVVFMGVNWERTEDVTQHLETARDYVKKNGITFPSVIDPRQVVTNAYLVEGFPSAYVIDREGKIRFRNVGVADGIEHIIEAQIESLLD